MQPTTMTQAALLLQRLLAALIVAGGLVHVALRLPLLTDPRIDAGGGEMNVVYGTQKILLGKALYTDPEAPPFEVVQYTPLYHASYAAIAKAFGVDPHDTMRLYTVGRAWGLLLNLLSCALVCMLCRRVGLDGWSAAAASALALAFITDQCYNRPDALATPLLLAALLLMASRPLAELSWPRAFALAALAAAALLTKQAAISAALTAGLFLVLLGQRKALVRFLACFALACALAFLVLRSMAEPTVLWKNLVLSLRNGISFTLYHALTDQGIYKYYVGWHLLGAAAAAALLRRSRTEPDRLLAVAALIAAAVGLITGVKRASGLNYLVDAHLLAAVAGLAWLRLAKEPLRAWGMLAVMGYGALFMQHRARLLAHRVGTPEMRVHAAEELASDQAVDAWLLAQWGNRLDHPVFITYRGHLELLMNGLGQLPQKDIIEWSVTPPFDLEPLKRMMENGQVHAVIAEAPIDTFRFFDRRYPLEHLAEVKGRHVHRFARR